MRILFFTHYFPPEGNAPASRTHEHCKRWVAAGHDVTVITCVPNIPDGVVYDGYQNRFFSQHEEIDGINVIRVWTYIAPNKGTARRIINYISYMISAFICSLRVKRPDVVIATSPQFFCGWAGVLYRWFWCVPFILEIRDIWPESILAVGAMNKSRFICLLEWLELRMYAAASHIITVGEGYREKLLQKRVPDASISVVMNGVNRDVFSPKPPDNALVERWAIKGRFVCGYVGTIGMACGLHTVLNAAQILKKNDDSDIVFMLVGDGAVKQELENNAHSLDLHNVLFTGLISKEMIPSYLSIMDVCLVCLRKSDLFSSVMPSKIFEASAMERPIINSVPGFAAEFIEKANAGINIDPENEEHLVNALLMLKERPDLRNEYGTAGRNYVLSNFDREILADAYLSIIKNTMMKEGIKGNT